METKDSVGTILNGGDTVIVSKTLIKRDVQNTEKRG